MILLGEELVYLDPHTTQMSEDLGTKNSNDESYHCCHSSRMKILDLDPSIALVSAIFHCRLNRLPHAIYWKSPISVLGTSN